MGSWPATGSGLAHFPPSSSASGRQWPHLSHVYPMFILISSPIPWFNVSSPLKYLTIWDHLGVYGMIPINKTVSAPSQQRWGQHLDRIIVMTRLAREEHLGRSPGVKLENLNICIYIYYIEYIIVSSYIYSIIIYICVYIQSIRIYIYIVLYHIMYVYIYSIIIYI